MTRNRTLGRDTSWSESVEEEDGPLVVAAAAISAAWAKRVPLGIWVALCLATGIAYAHSIPPTYTATATLLLDPRQPTTSRLEQGAASQTPSLDSAQAESQIQVIRSERLLMTVFDGLGLASSPELASPAPGPIARARSAVSRLLGQTGGPAPDADELRQMAFGNFEGRFSVRRIGLSYVVDVSYSSGDPTQARRVANATVSAYLGQSVTFKADVARGGAEFLQSRVNALVEEARAASAGVMAGTLPEAPTPDADARVISAALQPLTRSAPRTGLIVAFSGCLGLMIGFFSLAIYHTVDRRVHTADGLTRDTGVPCLGTIPDIPRRASGIRRRSEFDLGAVAVNHPDSAFAAAIRDLRTAILMSAGRAKHGGLGYVIALASWSPDAGCTLLSANLARVVRSSGHSAVLIDADVHRFGPGLTTQTGTVEVGLADALVSGDLIHEMNFVSLGGVPLVPARSNNNTPTYNAYLGAPEMLQLLDKAKVIGDVFIDLPPLCSANDARALATYTDAVLLVAVAGRTTRDEISRSVVALESAGARVLGVVLNRAK